MSEIRFFLNISPDAYLAYYEGAARSVVARGLDGRTVKFPADVLRRHLTRDGIRGLFALEYDDNGKFTRIRKLGDGEREDG